MGPPLEDSAAGSTDPRDRRTLRLLGQQVTTDPLVVDTWFDADAYEPRLLTATLDIEQYPNVVATARVDIRWFTTGDFFCSLRRDSGR